MDLGLLAPFLLYFFRLFYHVKKKLFCGLWLLILFSAFSVSVSADPGADFTLLDFGNFLIGVFGSFVLQFIHGGSVFLILALLMVIAIFARYSCSSLFLF